MKGVVNTGLNYWAILLLLLAGAGLTPVWSQDNAGCDPLGRSPVVDFQLTYDPATNRYIAWYVPTDNALHRLATGQFTIIAPNGFTTPGATGRDANFQITNINGVWTDFVFDNELITSASQSALPILNGLAVHQVGMAPAGIDVDPDGAGPQTAATPVTPGVAVPLFSFPGTGCASLLRILVNGEPIRNAIMAFGGNVNNEITIQTPRAAQVAALERYCKNTALNTATIVLPDIQDATETLCATTTPYANNYFTQVLRNWNPATLPAGTSVLPTASQQWGTFIVSPASMQGNVTINPTTGVYTITFPTVGGVTQPGSVTICNTLRDNCNTATDQACVVISWLRTGSVSITTTTPDCLSNGAATATLTATDGFTSYTWRGPGLTASTGNPVTATLPAAGVYAYTVTASNGQSCSATGSQTVTVAALPTFTLTPTRPTACSGTTGNITVTGLESGQPYTVAYTGSAAGTLSQVATGSGQILIGSLPAGSYSVTIAKNGCTSASQAVTVAPGPECPQPPTQPTTPDLTLTKRVNKARAAVGDVVTYTVTVTNNGTVSASAVTVQEALSAGLTLVPGSVSTTAGALVTGNPGNLWTIASLAAGATATLTFSASITQIGVVYNTAILSGDTATACTTVPIKVCKGAPIDVELAAPAGYRSYQWFRDGVAIAGATRNTYTITQLGAFTVQVNNGECPNGSCCPMVVEEEAGISYALVPQAPTCTGNQALTNGGLTINGLGTSPSSFSYAISPGNSFTTTNPVMQAIPANGLLASTLAGGQTYTIRVINAGGCSEDRTVTIPAASCGCATPEPTIICAIPEICQGESTTLTAIGCAGGTVRWSDGRTAMAISITPTVTTIYTASCVVGNCTSSASNSITVTVRNPQAPTIVASADNVCPGASVTLTASGCSGGKIEWSEGPQTGASIVVNPYAKTTYTAQCRLGSCLSTAATKTIMIRTELPTPTIAGSLTSVCPGGSVTLTVASCLGTPHWSSTTATTGSIVVNPTTSNNSYTVYCATGTCSSKASQTYTVLVLSPAIPTISADVDTVCVKGNVVLTAIGCAGTVVWSNGLTGSSITIHPEATSSYSAQCKLADCLSDPSASLPITVVTPSTPIVKASSLSICSGNVVSLTVVGCAGTVNWVGTDKVGSIIQILPTETKDYYVTCQVGSCISNVSNKLRITVRTTAGTAPTLAASSLAVCSGRVVSLTATGCTGEVIWSDTQRGTVISVTATPTNKSFYAVCQPTSNSGCASGSSNVINLDVTPTPRPAIVRCVCSADTICPSETVKLNVKNCQGTPTWSTGETTVSISVSPSATTSYSVYCKEGVCQSEASASYTVTVIPIAAPRIVASATMVAPGGTLSLTATGCAGEVIWSANDINGSNKGNVLVVRPDGAQTYYAQCGFHDCLSVASNTITVNKGDCVVKAGTLVPVNPTVCVGTSSSVTVSATPNGGLIEPAGYSVLYVLTKGAGLLVEQTSATPSFSVSALAANYTIHTLVYNAIAGDKNYLDLSAIKPGITSGSDVIKLIADRRVCADLDLAGAKVGVKEVTAPTLTASSLTACAGSSVTLTAAGCEGGTVTWNDQSVGASIVKQMTRDLSMTATCSLGGCISRTSRPVTIKLGNPAIPAVVINKPVICTSEPVSLTAVGCIGGTYSWSDPATTTGPVLTVTPTQTVQYRVKCVIGQCASEWSAYNTITVGTPAAPTISRAGGSASTTVCAGTPVTLVAAGCSGGSSVIWSNEQVGASITVSPVATMTYTARCNGSVQCTSAPSNAVTITVLPTVAHPTVIDKTNTCPANTIDLNTAVTSSASAPGGIVEFYTEATLSVASKVANPAAVGTGTYYVVERTLGGCLSLPVAIHAQITSCGSLTPCDTGNPATANAGPDARICAAKTYHLAGVLGGAGKTAHWTTSGTGTFDNAFALNAVYTASAGDVLAGKVTLTLSVSANNPTCPVATDAMMLTIDGSKISPVIALRGATTFCSTDSVVLKAPDGAAGYLWSNKATTQTIVVKTSGVYSVQVLDASGCSSVKSDSVVVNVAAPVLPPLVSNLRNSCPSKIVDLTKAISSTAVGTSYSYRICECSTANVVIRPDSVCEGTYWIVAKGPTGCLSAPAKVKVRVFDCATDTLTTDVAIIKTADKSVVKRGELIMYTLTVSNKGKHTAHNIDVRDVLPAGLALVAGTSSPKYSVSNRVITRRIDSLPVGKTESIVYMAHTLAKGEVTNTAEITYLDNVDTNPGNNRSSVTVRDMSSATALPVGLLGVAKSVASPALVQAGVYAITYTIKLSNMGIVPLKNVQVVDNLSETFRHGALLVDNVIQVTPDAGLTANAQYTGKGQVTKLLVDSLSTLPVGASRSLSFVVRVDVRHADSLTFYNTAYATALTPDNTVIADTSTSGMNPDPINTLDPRDSNTPTAISLNSLSMPPSIGVAMAVADTIRQLDGSFNVVYQIVVQNFGPDTLVGVSISDSLSKVFNSFTGASYSVVRPPITTSTGSMLRLNTAFNGDTEPLLVLGDSSSTLLPGHVDTLLVTVNVASNGSTTTFLNSVFAQARSRTGIVSDVSTNGLIADLNGNGDPTNDNEREATPLNLPLTNVTVFIPEGFSPNGDGINDRFVIRGLLGVTVSLEVYNRWGNLIYKNDDYRNDWDGKPNTGLAVGSADGLPDGTYYYMIRTSDGRKFVRYITISR